jgi:hypothetical protein
MAIAEPAYKARLATLTRDQQFIRDAPLLLVRLADWHGSMRSRPSALIAAGSLGLCAVCNLPEQLAEALQLPPHASEVFGISVG